MASIIEGQQYALNSQFSNNRGQSMVFVKLTDSALKAIEDYAAAVSKGNVSPSFKPSIEFRPNNSQGVISIPTKENSTEIEKQSYSFSVKDVQNDGIQECVQQRRNLSMESLGKIMLRMQIQANDDSYENTKVKMVAAEQEQKNNYTKVIQSGVPNVGRKGKLSRAIDGKRSHFAAPPNSSSMNTKKSPSMPLSSMPRFNNPNSLSANGNSSKPTTSFNGFQTTTNAPSSEATKKAIRGCIIHFLALRPLKVGDLLSKVQERLKEVAEKGTILGILNTVSSIRDGVHHLNDSVWDEVQLDWPHYSKEERDLVQKRNPLLMATPLTTTIEPSSQLSSLKPAIANSSGNSISPLSDSSLRSQSSPASVNTSPYLKTSPNNRTALKRNEPTLYANNSLKKFKGDYPRAPGQINGKTHSGANSSAIANNSSPLDKLNNNSSLSDQDSPESRNSCYKSSISLIHESSNLLNKKTDSLNDKDSFNVGSYQRISGNGSGSINSTPNSSPDSGISHLGNVPSSDSSTNNDADDYISKYFKIQDNEQLTQYRNDFHAEYSEYRRLYDYVDGVSRQFEELRVLILSKDEESEEWHDLIRQTIEKYDEVKHKSRYSKAQKRLNYLHFKLTHIKNLINDYSSRNPDKIMVTLPRFGSTALKS